jgi:hypothetical protein
MQQLFNMCMETMPPSGDVCCMAIQTKSFGLSPNNSCEERHNGRGVTTHMTKPLIGSRIGTRGEWLAAGTFDFTDRLRLAAAPRLSLKRGHDRNLATRDQNFGLTGWAVIDGGERAA